MVIHTKDKPKLHVKSAPEAKIKGGNAFTADRNPKTAGNARGSGTDQNHRRKTAMKIRTKGETARAMDKKASRENMCGNDQTATKKRSASGNAESAKREGAGKTVQKENTRYVQYCKIRQDREKAMGKKNSRAAGSLVSAGARASLNQMEGGSEVYDSCMAARNLARPVGSATDAGRKLYRIQAARAKEKRIKKVQAGKKISKKAAKESAAKAAKETPKAAVKAAVKKTAKEAAKTTAKAAAAAAGTAAGIIIDKREVQKSTRNRMIQLFVAKLRQEENQDSIGKVLKDIVLMRFSMLAKYIIRYVGLFLLALFALVALMALPIIAVIAIIYNSPFAIFFPSISSGDTTQDVISAYVAEFNREVNEEVTNHSGYDESEKIYVDFEGAGEPDNYCDILAVYMVKHGNGDTATDMTDKAKQNLKAVFEDMCSYTITSRTETEEDEEGNTTITTIKEVNVVLKTYRDMISVYGFDTEEQEMLAELMKPEYLAMMGYTGGGGDPGESISPEQYQAIVDSISDANGKRVVEFVLSKVGYPYSQQYRDSPGRGNRTD